MMSFPSSARGALTATGSSRNTAPAGAASSVPSGALSDSDALVAPVPVAIDPGSPTGSVRSDVPGISGVMGATGGVDAGEDGVTGGCGAMGRDVSEGRVRDGGVCRGGAAPPPVRPGRLSRGVEEGPARTSSLETATFRLPPGALTGRILRAASRTGVPGSIEALAGRTIFSAGASTRPRRGPDTVLRGVSPGRSVDSCTSLSGSFPR